MSRYVDIEPYEDCVLQRHYRNSMGECIETFPLCGLPIADVQEVKHGHWKSINRNKYNDDEATCSVCGVTFSSGYSDPSWWDYCPNCGSRMDLDGDTE